MQRRTEIAVQFVWELRGPWGRNLLVARYTEAVSFSFVAPLKIRLEAIAGYWIRPCIFVCHKWIWHNGEVIMGTIVYSTVYSGADQRKYQSSASLAFVWGIHRWPGNSPHKLPVTWKMFPFDGVIVISPSAHSTKGLLNKLDCCHHNIVLHKHYFTKWGPVTIDICWVKFENNKAEHPNKQKWRILKSDPKTLRVFSEGTAGVSTPYLST